MVIQEHIPKQKGAPWVYKCEDLFGVMEFSCTEQLTKDIVDSVIVALLGIKSNAQEVKGKIPYKEEDGIFINYTFKKAPQWAEDKKEICETDTYTSTKKLGIGYIVTRLSMTITLTISKLRRAVAAFLEAWKNN